MVDLEFAAKSRCAAPSPPNLPFQEKRFISYIFHFHFCMARKDFRDYIEARFELLLKGLTGALLCTGRYRK